MYTGIIYITDAPTVIIDMASSHQGIGYLKGLATLLRPRYDTHTRKTKYSILSVCSLWGFSASKNCLPHGSLHSLIQSLFSRSLIWYIMIFDSCSLYLVTLHHTGQYALASIANLYPNIVWRMPFFHKQSQYLFIILMSLSFNSVDAVSSILIPLAYLSQSSSWLYVII